MTARYASKLIIILIPSGQNDELSNVKLHFIVFSWRLVRFRGWEFIILIPSGQNLVMTYTCNLYYDPLLNRTEL